MFVISNIPVLFIIGKCCSTAIEPYIKIVLFLIWFHTVQTQNGLSPSARTCHSFYMFMKAFKADLTHNVNAILVKKDIFALVFQP